LIHFYKSPILIKHFSKNLVWDIQTSEKEIFVTFDDGPIPNLTEHVLGVLEDFEAKGTFFCVGDNIYKHPEVCKKVVDHGHIIANHTFNHLKGWTTKKDDYFMNIEKCQMYISQYQHADEKPMFRPPHGQITWKQIKYLRNEYHIIMWDVLAYDFNTYHSPEMSLKKMIQKTKKGSIVVFHDNYKAEKKLKYMLPKYLAYFKERGFKFKKLEFQ